MKIIFCDDSWQKKWDTFVKHQAADFGLLQAWSWGEFQEGLSKFFFRLAVVDEKSNILAVAQVIKIDLPLAKNYLYIPRGPILLRDDKLNQKLLELLFTEIKKLASSEGAIFLRLDPAWEDSQINQQTLSKLGFIFQGQVQPKQTLIIDLTKSEKTLLAEMKPKTRYNIKVAEKHQIAIDSGPDYFDDFWRLNFQTYGRHRLKSHRRHYFKTLIDILGRSGKSPITLWVAQYQGRVIAAQIMAKFNDWSVYLHGASDYNYRSKMAPYLLQWQVIRGAKKAGCQYYDFWGVDQIKWPGLTRFKKCFSPATDFTTYLGAWDEVYRRFWYNIYKVFKSK